METNAWSCSACTSSNDVCDTPSSHQSHSKGTTKQIVCPVCDKSYPLKIQGHVELCLVSVEAPATPDHVQQTTQSFRSTPRTPSAKKSPHKSLARLTLAELKQRANDDNDLVGAMASLSVSSKSATCVKSKTAVISNDSTTADLTDALASLSVDANSPKTKTEQKPPSRVHVHVEETPSAKKSPYKALAHLTLTALKQKANELGLPQPTGPKGWKTTWIDAIESAAGEGVGGAKKLLFDSDDEEEEGGKEFRCELSPAQFHDEDHSQSCPTDLDPDKVNWFPALGPIRFEGALYGVRDKPNHEDVHQGRLGDCYFAAALILVSKHDPNAIESAIKLISDADEVPRRFCVTLNHYRTTSRPHGAKKVTVEVNDVFYTHSFASHLGFVGYDQPRSKNDVDTAPEADKWGNSTTERLNFLADLRGVSNETKKTDGKLFSELLTTPRALYMNTGDRTSTGCIWPMLMEKAWIMYLLKHVDKCTEPFSYQRADAEANMPMTRIDDACLVLAGWNGHSDTQPVPPSPETKPPYKVYTHSSPSLKKLGNHFTNDVQLSREDLLGRRTFETCVLLWTNTATGLKNYLAPVCIGEVDGSGLHDKHVDVMVAHVRKGHPAALCTGKHTDYVGLHASHCYPILHYEEGSETPFIIRNPHNRLKGGVEAW